MSVGFLIQVFVHFFYARFDLFLHLGVVSLHYLHPSRAKLACDPLFIYTSVVLMFIHVSNSVT